MISVSSIAVDLARQAFDSLDGRRAVLIGAGAAAEATARALLAGGLPQLVVVNRTVGTARALAARFDGRGVSATVFAPSLMRPTSSSPRPTPRTGSSGAPTWRR
jgi:glutamyl-tRNA reductase